MLGTTSRTLRFYEEKGLVNPKKSSSNRRCYTRNQVEEIKNILLLRTLGLSLKTIGGLNGDKERLRSAVLEKRAEITAAIQVKAKEINFLNNVLSVFDEGKDIFNVDFGAYADAYDEHQRTIAQKCTKAFVERDFTSLYEHFSDKISAYMPIEVYGKIYEDTVAPLGRFDSYGAIMHDTSLPNVLYSFVKYENLAIRLKFVFYGEKIHGFWVTYYELDKLPKEEKIK